MLPLLVLLLAAVHKYIGTWQGVGEIWRGAACRVHVLACHLAAGLVRTPRVNDDLRCVLLRQQHKQASCDSSTC